VNATRLCSLLQQGAVSWQLNGISLHGHVESLETTMRGVCVVEPGESKFWIAPGKPENWAVAVASSTWGLGPTKEPRWNSIRSGDKLFFYVTSPISGVVGVGRITRKAIGHEPLWPREYELDMVLYPLRFRFAVERLLDPSLWPTKAVSVSDLKASIRSMRPVDSGSAEVLYERVQHVC